MRTMYRVLAEAHEVRERRAQARHPVYTKPELVATGPNQVWSWDITKLKGPIPYLYYSLYVILDLFSRYVVGWMGARHENAHLGGTPDLRATCLKQGIAPQQLTIHADRGAPMRSKLVALLFSDLSINASHSRPRVSNDNPFSESQFRTLKVTAPSFLTGSARSNTRAASAAICSRGTTTCTITAASAISRRPTSTTAGAATVLAVRHRTRLAAYAAHPERFVQGPTTARNAPNSRLDQSAAETDPRGCPRSDDRHPGRPAAWGDLPVTNPSAPIARSRSSPAWGRYSKCCIRLSQRR